jgi:hypothetical protein
MSAEEGEASHRNHERPFEIIVNGQKKEWDENRISFEQLVHLAYPNPPPPPPGGSIEYTISYTKGPPKHPQGTLKEGQSVEVIDGMVFDVVPTVKS